MQWMLVMACIGSTGTFCVLPREVNMDARYSSLEECESAGKFLASAQPIGAGRVEFHCESNPDLWPHSWAPN